MCHRVVLGLLILFSALSLQAQSPQEQPTFGTGTTAVVIDVVVRDRKGNPVTDLGKKDFELLEDGVKQDIADVTLVAPLSAHTNRASAAQAQASPVEPSSSLDASSAIQTPVFVALVFDRLSPDARALAHKGALTYLETVRHDDFAGVFISDQSLVTVQTFTNDVQLVRAAIDDAAGRATSVYDRQADRVSTRFGDVHPAASPTASAEHQGPPDPNTKEQIRQAGDREGDELGLARMAVRMERAFEALVRDAQGHATTNALLALIEGLGMLPGRKTIVFFAEGLAIPPAVQARFASVIAAANHHNVSIYTVDAAGLRVHSKAAEAARQVVELGAAGVGDIPRGSAIGLKDLELNEDILRQDPSVSLAVLAERTGGFLINNTNDLASGFRDIDADRRFHYLLTYTPKNDSFGGEWRNVTVRVPNRRVEIRARSGYQALRTSSVIPLLPWEAPALALLERPTPPRDIPIRLGVLMFPMTNAESRVPILVGLPADRVAFEVTEDGFRTDFTVLARVLDETGEVVRKGSQPYRLSGPREQVDAARSGEVLFYRQPSLEPGTYTLEVAVLDTFARRGTVERQIFTVPPVQGLGVSSLVLVGRGERVPATEQDPENPLYVGNVLVYPNLGAPINKTDGAITLFLTVVPVAGRTPSAELELLRGAEALAKVPLNFDSPVAGRIQQLWRVPIDRLELGDYRFRVTVADGGEREVREASVRVVE
jgi:VWFA-related protein